MAQNGIEVERYIMAVMLTALLAVPGLARGEVNPALPPGASPSLRGSESVRLVKSPVIMRGLYGTRSPGSRGAPLLSAPGPTTDTAVMRALRWFKSTQRKNGAWVETESQAPVLTGLALLSFLGHGETLASPEFGTTVEKAITYLISSQEDEGYFGSNDGALGEQAIITRSLCEAYGLARHPQVGEAAEKGVALILSKQDESGFWHGSEPANRITTSVWCVMALRSAHMAGVPAPMVKPALAKAGRALLSALESAPPSREVAPVILALQLLGLGDEPHVRSAFQHLEGVTMDWEKPGFANPIYQWDFLTKANFSQGGKIWSAWNRSSAPTLVQRQTVIPAAIETHHRERRADIGYWDSPGTDEQYGRTYSTALCCQMLEVYYAFNRQLRPLRVIEPTYTEHDDDLEIDITE
jgi:hypothetical protein